MKADQQDAADSTGGQSDGYSWEFSSDGRFDATENWRRIQSARIRNETAEEAEDQRTEPMSVARDMIAGICSTGGWREGSAQSSADFGREIQVVGQG